MGSFLSLGIMGQTFSSSKEEGQWGINKTHSKHAQVEWHPFVHKAAIKTPELGKPLSSGNSDSALKMCVMVLPL